MHAVVGTEGSAAARKNLEIAPAAERKTIRPACQARRADAAAGQGAGWKHVKLKIKPPGMERKCVLRYITTRAVQRPGRRVIEELMMKARCRVATLLSTADMGSWSVCMHALSKRKHVEEELEQLGRALRKRSALRARARTLRGKRPRGPALQLEILIAKGPTSTAAAHNRACKLS